MMLFAVFLIIFVGGPMLFSMLTKSKPSGRAVRILGGFVVGFALGGLWLRYGMPAQSGQNFQITAVSILLMWCAWVSVLAFGAQLLRCLDRGAAMRRWSGVMGALGTTVPWFGLALAASTGT